MAKTEGLTQREFLEKVVKTNTDKEILAFAKLAISKLDKANEDRKNNPTKASLENKPIADAIVKFMLTSKANIFLAKDIAAGVSQSTQKTSAVLRALVDEGRVIKIVPATRSKSMEYKLPVETATATATEEVPSDDITKSEDNIPQGRIEFPDVDYHE